MRILRGRLQEQIEEEARAEASQTDLMPHTVDASIPADDPDTFVWDGTREAPKEVTKVRIAKVTSIGKCAFMDYTSLTTVTIPNSVVSIGDFAFKECTGLISITIPKSVTSIGDSAFARCSSLKSITIPSGVTSIENGTFYGCSSLTNIVIPNNAAKYRIWCFL